jgi:hypothetical protein
MTYGAIALAGYPAWQDWIFRAHTYIIGRPTPLSWLGASTSMTRKKKKQPTTTPQDVAIANPGDQEVADGTVMPAASDADLEVVLDDMETNGRAFSRSLLSAIENAIPLYARVFSGALNAFMGISKTPQGQQMLSQHVESQKHRDDAMNAQLMARAEIDRAIAKRLETADSVEIEEYYDASGKGHAGLNFDDKTAKVGIGGEGQKIVKRKIILKGTISGNHLDAEHAAPALEPATPKNIGLN